MPKYLGYFERVLSDNPAGSAHAVGDKLTTVDLSLFQIWEGTAYAFPHAFADTSKLYPALAALTKSVAAQKNVAAYLASDRRIPFNTSGISATILSSTRGPEREAGRRREAPVRSGRRLKRTAVFKLSRNFTGAPQYFQCLTTPFAGTPQNSVLLSLYVLRPKDTFARYQDS